MASYTGGGTSVTLTTGVVNNSTIADITKTEADAYARYLVVKGDAVANDILIYSSGSAMVQNGGTINGAIVNGRGRLEVSSGGVANDISTTSGTIEFWEYAGGTATNQVWGSTAGNIPANSFAECRIRYQAEGVEITPAEAAAKAQPSRLVIVLGADGLDSVDEESFIEGYVSLIRSIREASPQTVIIVCSISSVTTGYSGVDGSNANVIRTVNGWIQTVCMRTGAYYCDSASALNDRAGWLDSDYAAVNGKALNTAGLQKFLEYLRHHAV